MSSTEPQTGVRFRLGSSRGEKASGGDDAVPSEETITNESPEADATVVEPTATADEQAAAAPVQAEGEPTSHAAKQTRLMADLTRAMQTAALTARSATMEQFAADAKSQTEAIHKRAESEATDLRQRSEDDVAAIRDWSKAEMARLREETEGRISARRSALEHELEAHTGRVERRLERLQERIRAYETRMDRFFEQLMAEENAARIATMAEQMPEPPSFDIDDDYGDLVGEAEPTFAAGPAVEVPPTVASADVTDGAASGPDGAVPETTETAERITAESVGESDNGLSAWGDPRLAALGETSLESAEAEAEAAAGSDENVEEVPEMDDETLAARLAGILPEAEQTASDATAEPTTTQVKVVGLVSVAAIAGFKRSLSRVEGVTSVGVSSGPDGHFLFAVAHGPSVALRDAISTFAGFEARVTGAAEGTLEVTARDPEAGS